MTKRIFLSPPHLSGNELEALRQTLDSNWIAPSGPNIRQWSEELSKKIGGNKICLTNSGTSAMHLALKILGVKRGDIVLVQSHNHIGSVNPIKYLSAKPVFIDSERESWNMDPSLLEDALRRYEGKVKAIIPVHIYGMPADLMQIKSLAKKYGIPIVEDAAESLGSTYDGKYTGTIGELGIYSFNGNKIITTSAGGALSSNVAEMIDRASFYANQAKEEVLHFEHQEIGYNYSMSNVLASIGREQLKWLDDRVSCRRKNFEIYESYFSNWNKKGFNIQFQIEGNSKKSNRWLTGVVVDSKLNNGLDRDMIMDTLSKNNIESRPFWKPMHLQPVFKNEVAFVNGVSEYHFQNGVCLPSGSSLDNQDFERIFQVFNGLFEKFV